jgi:hypothetical protein
VQDEEEGRPAAPGSPARSEDLAVTMKSMASSLGGASVEFARAGPTTPEGKKMTASLTELYSDGERESLVKGMSPKQKSQPIWEAMRSSGAFSAFEDEGEGSDEELSGDLTSVLRRSKDFTGNNY